MPDIIYTLNYVPGQFDDTPENEQDEQRIKWDNATGDKIYKLAVHLISGSIKYQQGLSERSEEFQEIMASSRTSCFKAHALVMIFLRDKNGWYGISKIKDAVIHPDKYPELYYQLIMNMIIMYHKCRLVHADLSEYNLLKGVRVIRELFDFIIDINIGLDDEKVETELDKIQVRLASQQELSITLNEDIDKMSKDLIDEELIYRKLTGLSIDDKAEKIPNENEVMVKSENVSSISTKDDKDEGDEENEYDDVFKKQSRGKQNEDNESKKVRICLVQYHIW
ncbi:hypothetical protein C1646_756078 [Rhizophagus diaphanus]|nr:hypothetical protein C1646_756078 [Rhizophagus diaphanus] [Rhizophagus sp. MUCL 43196]